MNPPAETRPRMVVGLRLLRLVGSGGEGEVWEARDEHGRQRALKLIRPDALAPDAEARSRHLLAIDHPAFVRVYRGGRLQGASLDGWGFLEMEFIDGPSLQDAPPDPAVLDRLWPLAEALDLLHAGEWTQGLPLVHRDVKPANLVEDASGELVLVDPSTLRGLDATHLTRIGTPVFSAPEVMSGRFGPPADVYSFAVTVVALLTGARGEELAELLEHAHELDLPDGVAFALSPVPADRPSSCRAVLEAGTELADDPTILLPAIEHQYATFVDHQRSGLPAGAGHLGQPPEPPPERRRRLWPWTWLFVLLAGVPLAGIWSEAVPRPLCLPVIGVVLAVHLLAQAAGRGSLALAVLCPPIAWAVLLGRRVRGGRRRHAWTTAVLITAMAPMLAGAVALVQRGVVGGQSLAMAGTGLTLVLVPLCVAAAAGEGRGAVVVRVLLTPLWAVGAVLLIVAGLVLSPFGLARGTVWSTMTSLGAGVRGPAMMRGPEGPRPWR